MTMSSFLLLIAIILVICSLYMVVSTKREVRKLQKIVNIHMVEIKNRMEEK